MKYSGRGSAAGKAAGAFSSCYFRSVSTVPETLFLGQRFCPGPCSTPPSEMSVTRSEQAPGVPQEGPGPGAGPAVGGGGRASPQPAPPLLTLGSRSPAPDAAPHLSPPGPAFSPFPLLREPVGSAHRPAPSSPPGAPGWAERGSGDSDLRGCSQAGGCGEGSCPARREVHVHSSGSRQVWGPVLLHSQGGRPAFQAQGPGVRNRPGKSADSQCSKL